MTMVYIVMSGVAIQKLIIEPQSFIFVWANLISIWFVGYLAAFLADEADRARRTIADAKEKVENFSKVDWLTGLYNMRHFDILSAQELARAERYTRPLSLLLLDSDHLKVVNDSYGHQMGDQLIADVARIVSQQARASDTVIRYGGDEFIVLLPETDSVGARFLAERIRQAVEGHLLDAGGRPVGTTVSIGIAAFPRDAQDAIGLLARADAALYTSKETGRNRVTTYTEGMTGGQLHTPLQRPEPTGTLA
jgi:diguanylate cyclase (GGDEF)-like protein